MPSHIEDMAIHVFKHLGSLKAELLGVQEMSYNSSFLNLRQKLSTRYLWHLGFLAKSWFFRSVATLKSWICVFPKPFQQRGLFPEYSTKSRNKFICRGSLMKLYEGPWRARCSVHACRAAFCIVIFSIKWSDSQKHYKRSILKWNFCIFADRGCNSLLVLKTSAWTYGLCNVQAMQH